MLFVDIRSTTFCCMSGCSWCCQLKSVVGYIVHAKFCRFKLTGWLEPVFLLSEFNANNAVASLYFSADKCFFANKTIRTGRLGVNVPGLSKPFVLDSSGWAGSVLVTNGPVCCFCFHFILFLVFFVHGLVLTQFFVNKVCDQSRICPMQHF